FVAVAGGDCYSLGLKGDGSIVAWGWNQYDQCDVPEPNTDFVAVAGGFGHSLGLKGEPGPGNEPPVADAGGPYFGTVDQPVTFDASDSQDPDGTIVGYRWDWTDDGEWDTDWLPEPITTYAYDAEFVGQLKLEVEDDGGDRDTGSALVWVGGGGDAPPVADAGGPYGALQFVPMMFDGTRSYDPDGQVVRYDWKFHTADSWCNDVGPTPQFMYMATGPQFVTLRVHDDHGAIDTASTCVTVYDDPSALPLAFIDSITPHPAVYGEPVQFQGHGRTIEGGFTMSAYEWSSDVDGIIGTSAEFTTSTLSLGRHEVSFRVQAPNGIWSQSATDVLLISEDENYGTTIVTPPYRWAHADYGGLGLLAAAYQQSNLSNGSFNTIASAGVIGGVYSWAWQGLSLAVRNPKEITIDGEIIHVSGNPQYGISCVAGNAKLGWIDYNHNSQVDDGEWFADYIDPPLSFETALAKIISAACMIVGAAAGPDLPGIGAAAPWISLLATFVSGPQVVYDVYEADPEHDFKNVRFTFDADGGEITHVAVGIKSEASACILGTGVAAIGGQLSKVKITGMYPPDQPDVTGPEPPVGYVDVPYEFTATATDVTPTDDVSYEFDWGDSSGSGWTEFVPSGTGVTRSHAFSEPGEYDVIARAWDGDSILVLAEQIDMISEDSALYTMLIVERGDVVFTALCPMDLVITDPEGRLVAKTWSSVPGVEYVEKDLNRDGELDDRVLIRDALSGTYKVRVLPEADADRSETFSLFASSGGKSFVLARDVRISDIPEGGYRFVMGGKPDVEDAAVDSGTVQPISGR
ncbi:MAG: hypothetical protein KAY37_02570, partial [Phycisphaerae bacterium]|nr:hypothetical protein [Phycisphaerae bacterium]